MTPRSLFAVLLAVLGVWNIVPSAILLLSFITGPFASLLVGAVLLLVARRLYSGTPMDIDPFTYVPPTTRD